MAYQAKSRDPLLDSDMQAAIKRRVKELIGLVMIALGVMAAAMIWSYTPDDPHFMVSTDAAVQNWMGPIGALVAALLFMVIGWGSWGIALVPLAWGVRLVGHYGAEQAISRLIFAPIAIACVSIYCATLEPGAEWQVSHSFKLGGLFGDMVMGALLTLFPSLESAFSLGLMSLLMAVGVVILGAFVLGFTRSELIRAVRFAGIGLVMVNAVIITGVSGVVALARQHRSARAERRAELVALVPDPDPEPMPDRKPAHGGLLSRIPTPIKWPEPELIEPVTTTFDTDASDHERIQARIADVIRSRATTLPEPKLQPEPLLTRGMGRFPDPLVLNTNPTPDAFPPEPPVLAPPPTEHPSEPPVTTASVASALPLHTMVSKLRPPVAEPPKAPEPSRCVQAAAQPSRVLESGSIAYELLPLNLLTNPAEIVRHHLSAEALEENARMLKSVLDDYGVKGEIVNWRPGPVVTMYELEPAPGLKASRVIGLADDIARSMAALSARVSTVPGRSVIGIELPNKNREKVVLREILASRDFGDSNMSLPLALGKDIGGDSVVANLARMPHLLIAGTTGSGKSVAINTMILSLLYKLTPDECRLIMIDPKMLELSVYDGIPHLLSPVVTDPKKAVVALKWVVGEMEDRYRKMSKMGVRNIEGYNGRVREVLDKGEMFLRTVQTGFDDETGDPIFETEEIQPVKLPYIVVVVDEMADLMMVAGKEIEACIQRLAQMARASGIHLIMATQRPSVDVITGTIKANFPTRISFQVTSKVDSRTILGEMGAEQLLGMGDMLYMAGGAKIEHCHGPFVSDEEVEEVVNHLKAFGPPEYVGGVVEGPDEEKADNIDAVLGLGGNTDGEDALYDQAVAIAIKDRKCSTSYIQRKLAIGYNKAARLVEQMEDEGVVSAANHVGKREILVPEPQ